jgi:hypothetical protein
MGQRLASEALELRLRCKQPGRLHAGGHQPKQAPLQQGPPTWPARGRQRRLPSLARLQRALVAAASKWLDSAPIIILASEVTHHLSLYIYTRACVYVYTHYICVPKCPCHPLTRPDRHTGGGVAICTICPLCWPTDTLRSSPTQSRFSLTNTPRQGPHAAGVLCGVAQSQPPTTRGLLTELLREDDVS